MATLIEKLNKAVASKNAIKTAITEKSGVDAGNVFSSYADQISNMNLDIPIAKKIVDNFIKYNYIDDNGMSIFDSTKTFTISDDAIVGIKTKIDRDSSRNDLGVVKTKVYTETNHNQPAYKLSYYTPEYTTTLEYIRSITSDDFVGQSDPSALITDASVDNIHLSYAVNDEDKALLVIPEYGIFLNTAQLTTGDTLYYDSDGTFTSYLKNYNGIYMFPCVEYKYKKSSADCTMVLPLFAFDLCNQARGGTAIDWSQVFPVIGVKYGDL
jgi:hypothetical protein